MCRTWKREIVENDGAFGEESNQCQQVDLLSPYYPVALETFQLPYEPDQSTLAEDLAAIQPLWKQTQRQHSHMVADLKLPWIISQGNRTWTAGIDNTAEHVS